MTELTDYRDDRVERVEERVEKAMEAGIRPGSDTIAEALEPHEYTSVALQAEIHEGEDGEVVGEYPYALVQFPEPQLKPAKVWLQEEPPEDEEEE